MPLGFSLSVGGYLSYCAVKFVGYSLAAKCITLSYERPDLNAFYVGGVRTLLGMSVGAVYFGAWHFFSNEFGIGGLIYFIGLVPVRFLEWWLILRIFLARRPRQPWHDAAAIVMATVWSFILDLPGVFGYLAMGGISVC